MHVRFAFASILCEQFHAGSYLTARETGRIAIYDGMKTVVGSC